MEGTASVNKQEIEYTESLKTSTAIITVSNTADDNINRNKPWRIIIRRQVSDGRSDNQSIS